MGTVRKRKISAYKWTKNQERGRKQTWTRIVGVTENNITEGPINDQYSSSSEHDHKNPTPHDSNPGKYERNVKKDTH